MSDDPEKIDEEFFSRIDARKEQQRKRRIKFAAYGTLIILASWASFYLFAPFKGGMTFAACKTFVELYVRYPNSIRLSQVRNFGESIRIWYSHIDAFGEYRLENMECFFRADEKNGFAIDRILVNRRPIEKDVIDRFNISIPAIRAYPPDLTYPETLPTNLEDLQLETERFWKVQL